MYTFCSSSLWLWRIWQDFWFPRPKKLLPQSSWHVIWFARIHLQGTDKCTDNSTSGLSAGSVSPTTSVPTGWRFWFEWLEPWYGCRIIRFRFKVPKLSDRSSPSSKLLGSPIVILEPDCVGLYRGLRSNGTCGSEESFVIHLTTLCLFLSWVLPPLSTWCCNLFLPILNAQSKSISFPRVLSYYLHPLWVELTISRPRSLPRPIWKSS